ncbi:MAG: insulinase family protein [Verrucomicrobia bacterium]|nr:insulinase family protein [Verrucomicrobiota bacterium]MBU4290665.1 insulinase family protein [Verrucomicrobiota bacterium]MBU4430371.1 insulinase family protein [Verrucomicrobiota bacterium]MCG2681144.1 insulinase family protein [Kiritimatiellia bacterium]
MDKALTQTTAGLSRFVLDNGMVILVKEDHTAPLVSIQIWLGTGSSGEEEYLGGGLSHWMEHMIFKGTPARPPGQISTAIDQAGGSINAYTATDRTVFLVDLPSRHWRLGIEVLADALHNASFPNKEWQREKDVILREMAMMKDNPDRQLNRLLWETAYRVHPCRVPVIGYEDIFQSLTRQDLITFFHRYYVPDNMIVVLTGDIRATEAEAALREQFGAWPRRARAPAVMPPEPDQIGARFSRRTGPYAVTRVAMCWHTVALTHPDAPDLDILATLTGNGRSSRLVHDIKESKKLAHEISAWSSTPREPGLFGISAVCDPDKEPALIEAIQAEVSRWSTEPFHRDEIEKARRQLLTATLSEFQTMHGQARQFASGEFFTGTPFYFQTYLQRLERVSPESVMAVAHKYLQADNRTLAMLAPELKGHESANIPHPASAGKISKVMLSSGIPLLIREDHKVPMVWICAAGAGGLILENETNNGITALMAELLTRGTRHRGSDIIAQTIDSLGASLTAFSGHNSFGLRAQGLSRDASVLLEILADCLLAPTFQPGELDKRKTIQLAVIQQQREAPMFIAQEVLRQMLFPGHPYRFTVEGSKETIGRINAEQVRAWHAKTIVAGNAVVAIFGDITPDQAQTMAEKYFQTFPAGPPAAGGKDHLDPARYPQPDLPQRARRVEPREQAIILAGFPGIAILDERADALSILQQALNGLSSELVISIRDKQGLAYYAGAFQQSGIDPGCFAFYAGTRASALDRVEVLIRNEIQRVTLQGIRQDELDRARQKLVTDHAQRLQLNGELAFECALNELYGRGYEYSLKMEQRLLAVTREAVREAAASILNTNRMAIAIVEPEPDTTE